MLQENKSSHIFFLCEHSISAEAQCLLVSCAPDWRYLSIYRPRRMQYNHRPFAVDRQSSHCVMTTALWSILTNGNIIIADDDSIHAGSVRRRDSYKRPSLYTVARTCSLSHRQVAMISQCGLSAQFPPCSKGPAARCCWRSHAPRNHLKEIWLHGHADITSVLRAHKRLRLSRTWS